MNIDFRDVTIFLLVGALIWALHPCPTPRTAAALPVPETAADEGKVSEFGQPHVLRKASGL